MTTTVHAPLTRVLSARYDAVIEREVTRLGHRQPALTKEQIAIVDEVLRDLARRLVLDPVRRTGVATGAVEALFAVRGGA